ncbi:MAG: DUF2807 domain-containing protein [Bacteroidetes bacterium]|nr:DUF2807 domain-containing protein [Bacteroidota bacterium]
MKTLKNSLIVALILLAFTASVNAQSKGNGNITRQDRQVAAFDAIEVGCAINLFLSQGETQSVSVEADENLQEKINTKVSNGLLSLSCDNVRNATKMNIYVTITKLTKLEANGAAVVKGTTPINTDQTSIISSGAAKINLELKSRSIYTEVSGASKNHLQIEADIVNSEVSGAANLKIIGLAKEHKTNVSGAGSLKAVEFVTDNTNAEVSGAGNASVMARKQLKADLSGAGSITYFDNSNMKKIGKAGEYQFSFNGMDKVKSVSVDEDKDASEGTEEDTIVSRTDDNGNVEIKLRNNKIVVVTDDSVTVKLGNNTIEVDDDGDVKLKHNKKQKFNGHWKGLELGVNGFLTPNNDFDYASEYSLLDQKYQKSINVNLNFFEQDINLIKNHLGLVTGLGLSWNNYRFDNDVRLTKGSDKLYLSRDTNNYSFEKSKLVNTYLTLPLMLEFQTNPYSKLNSMHVSAGVVGGWRIGTHAKYVYNDGSRQKDKDHSDFYMNPFKLDAIAKIGWGVINVYATYSLTPMFQKNKGPELYPFSVGICLTDLTDL